MQKENLSNRYCMHFILNVSVRLSFGYWERGDLITEPVSVFT